jgi:two-component system NtrC family sensor kinase
MRSGYILFFIMVAFLSAPCLQAGNTDSLVSLLDNTLVNESQVELRLQIAREISNSDIKGALMYAREALSFAEEINSMALVADSKLAIGEFYDYLGVREEAIDHLMEALVIFEELNEPRKQAQALMLVGNAYWYLNQFESALKYYSQASRFAEALNDTSLIISVINARGAVYGNTGRMDSALILFREANSLSRQIDSRDQEILTYYNMGDVNLFSGNIDRAIGIFHDLENNYDLEHTSSKHLSNLYNSMTRAFILKGDVKWARRYSEKTREALSMYSRLTETREYYHNLYQIDSIEKNTQSALDHYVRYTRLNDSLSNASFRERLANLEIYFDLRAKEGEIERLQLDNQFKDLQIRQRMIINYGSISGIILLFTIVFLVVRSTLKTKEKNVALEMQTRALEKANLKISAQSRDLQDKNNELESVIEELKATQQHLVQSEKMASLGTLTAGIAHEINNPLNFISGGLGIIAGAEQENNGEGEQEKEERRSKALQMAFDGLERATGIVRALMTFSHKGASKLVKADLHEIIDNTLLFLHSKLSPGIEIRKDYQLKETIPVFPEKMHQVIMNIIDNAIYAVNQNHSGKKKITIKTQPQDGCMLLKISNNGPPIKEDHLHQLFDPFFTTKDPGEGTGLGLSICYTLISEHQGSIRAENLNGEVAFIIQLPC